MEVSTVSSLCCERARFSEAIVRHRGGSTDGVIVVITIGMRSDRDIVYLYSYAVSASGSAGRPAIPAPLYER